MAQLVFLPYTNVDFHEVDELENTERIPIFLIIKRRILIYRPIIIYVNYNVVRS